VDLERALGVGELYVRVSELVDAWLDYDLITAQVGLVVLP